jgi:hypothetical protein
LLAGRGEGARKGTIAGTLVTAVSTVTRDLRERADMAGKHEGPRDDQRADGLVDEGGEYVDSEIPGEDRIESREPAGEFVESEIPGDPEDVRQGKGSYDQSDIPGEKTPDNQGVGAYTDSDLDDGNEKSADD